LSKLRSSRKKAAQNHGSKRIEFSKATDKKIVAVSDESESHKAMGHRKVRIFAGRVEWSMKNLRFESGIY
jgi:hypothetical protein